MQDVVEVDESYLVRLDYHQLRLLAVRLGVLVQDDPNLDLLRQRVLQCQLM